MFPAGTFRRILLPENLGSEPLIRCKRFPFPSEEKARERTLFTNGP